MENSANKSSLLKDTIALFTITLIAAVLLGFVNELTKPVIEKQEAEQKALAYQAVFKEAALVDTEAEEIKAKTEASIELLKAEGLEGITIDEAGIAKTADGKAIGYVMTITTANGYGGNITIAMGYNADKMITSVEILSLNETPGLGMNATEESFKGQFTGKTAERLEVVKSGAADNQIDAISSATITSNAVTGAVNAGIAFASDCLENGIGGVGNE